MDSSRNIYKREIDFRALALTSPEFAKRLKSNDQLDFSDPDSIRQLTKSLLERDFKLVVDLPNDRLCPPIPNRFNYILWLQDLLDTSSRTGTDQYDPNRQVLGLDIGTGCCAIYPLLGCSSRPRWRFIATDIDSKNISSSRKSVLDNELDDRVMIMETKPSDPLIPFDKLDVDRVWRTGLPVRSAVLKPHAGWLVVGWTTSESQLLLDFVMCNPPFYESEDELVSSADAKSRPPFSACTGAAVEMITPGGEVAFIESLIKQSLVLKTQVLWYTSMFGKLSSVSVILQKLLDIGIHNWAVTEFVQGRGTRRWAVGWSFSDWRPRSDVSRGIASLPKHFLPFPSEYDFEIPGRRSGSLEHNIGKINTELSPLRYFHYTWYTKQSCIGYAREDVWSRKARRKFAREQHDGDSISHYEKALDVEMAALGFRIDLSLQADHSVDVVVRWIKGSDQHEWIPGDDVNGIKLGLGQPRAATGKEPAFVGWQVAGALYINLLNPPSKCLMLKLLPRAPLNHLKRREYSQNYASSIPRTSANSSSRAPVPREIEKTESVSTASLIDVDAPSVQSVHSDFLDQEVKTTTQAERIEREAEEAALAREKAAAAAASKKSKKSKAQGLSKNAQNPVYLGNAFIITTLSAVLGYGAYRKHAEGKLSWEVAGVWAGAVGLFAGADYFNSLFNSALKQSTAIRHDLDTFAESPATTSPALQGQISASLASFSRTIDDYAALTKSELIPEKKEKAVEREKSFRASLLDYRQQFERLRKEREETVSVTNRSELFGRRPHHAATPENPYADHALPRSSAFGNASSSSNSAGGLSFGAGPGTYDRETHALREQSFFAQTNTQLDEFLDRGRAVLQDLGQQRDILKNTQRRLYSVGNTLGISGDTIRRVERRAKEDKWIFWGGVVVFFLFCWLVIHFLKS
ncbi:hypothetical protein BHQ10_002731 [Talaromyces amestolkiae]|uniref:Uncharacterized protein n=1 Tax=Talaromyces amestolkiae TaxID=1196081 RepID=A0A364KT58_TALAM|nr:hypothetical protein BHQ10_002731 [Talaromyces amestolkiae]